MPGLGPCKPHVPFASWSLVGSALGRPEGDKKAGGGGSWDLFLPDLLLPDLLLQPHPKDDSPVRRSQFQFRAFLTHF